LMAAGQKTFFIIMDPFFRGKVIWRKDARGSHQGKIFTKLLNS
jgi:hypothetical protein